MHPGMIIVNNQLDANCSCMFIYILYMFRAVMCPTSGELLYQFDTRFMSLHAGYLHTRHGCPKYVENRNKHTWKIVCQTGYLHSHIRMVHTYVSTAISVRFRGQQTAWTVLFFHNSQVLGGGHYFARSLVALIRLVSRWRRIEKKKNYINRGKHKYAEQNLPKLDRLSGQCSPI